MIEKVVSKSKEYNVKGRIWIEIHKEMLMGEGKVNLLKKTAELGSLRKAADEMKMSYRKAWYSINQMNHASDEPLILLKHGGKHGGIAQITEFGEKIIEKFKSVEKEFAGFLELQTKFMNS
jgi:molybdate transport system regulatory protein